MGFLLNLIPGFTPAKGFAALALAVVVAGYVGYSEITLANRAAKIAEQASEISLLNKVNAENVRTVDRLKVDVADGNAALLAVEGRTVERIKTNTIIKREIVRVASETPAQCELAPSVLLVLDGLRPTAAGGEDRTRNGQPAR